MSDSDSPLVSIDAAPATIVELAAVACEYVRRAVGIELDFTAETLPIADHYAQLARAGLEQRAELEPLIARALGAYFGEVVRRRIPAFWHVPSEDSHEWRLCASRVLVALNPVGVAYDAIHRNSEHEGPSGDLILGREERAVVAARLEALPAVREQDFYLLSTRLEVLEIVEDALLGLEPPETINRFEWEDYAVLMAAAPGLLQ